MAPQSASTFGYFQPSPIPDVATAETILFMCGCIDGSARNALVQQAARDAVAGFGSLGAFDVAAGVVVPSVAQTNADLARAVYWYARYNIGRLHHGEFKALVEAFPEKKQLLISPDLLLTSYPQGDCSAFTMAICALLKCLGIGYELVAVAADGRDPSIFSHVYPRAIVEGGARLVLDAHAGPYPGWEVPAEDVFRKQVYDSQGTPVSDQPSGFKGLHMYQWRGGMGDVVCDSEGNCADDGSSIDSSGASVDSSGTECAFGAPVGGVCPSATPSVGTGITGSSCPNGFQLNAAGGQTGLCNSYPAGSLTAPSQSDSAAWANFATTLTKSGMTLAEINAIQPGTVVSANGSILRQSTGLAVPVGSGSSLTAALGSGSGSMLVLLAVGLGAFLLLKGKG
jgi:hypothetical protein